MGVVYKAEDFRLHRFVALKLLADRIAHDPASVTRFRREAQAAPSLNHPGICTIYDVGDEDGNAFIAISWSCGRRSMGSPGSTTTGSSIHVEMS